jgi:ATP-dependent Clp protease ATP-binding subunit ClpA
MGARPMARVMQEKIKKELANELLFGELIAGGSVTITLDDDALKFDCQASKKAASEV